MKKNTLPFAILLLLFSCHPEREIDNSSITIKIDSIANSFYQNGIFHGMILVAKNDSVIYKKGYGTANPDWDLPFTSDTKFRLASLSKSFTAILILQLAEEGKLKLTDKLIDYFPDFKGKNGDKISIHHLLCHSSGLSDYSYIHDPFRVKKYDYFDFSDYLKLSSTDTLRFEPGTGYHYCTTGFNLLNRIIEKTTSKTYDQVLNEKILLPAKMNNSGVNYKNIKRRSSTLMHGLNGLINAWEESSETGLFNYELYSTIDDLFAFNDALNTNDLLSDKSFELMYASHQKIDNENSYGYGWNISTKTDSLKNDIIKAYSHGGYSGYSGSYLYRDVNNKICIIFLDNVFYSRHPELRDQILNVLHNRPYELSKKSIFQTVREKIASEGIDAGIQLYLKIRDDSINYYTSGWELDYLKLSFREQGLVEEFIKLHLIQYELYPIFKQFTKIQIKKMDFIIKHEPENGIMYACRGGLYYSQKNYKKAETDLLISLEKGIPEKDVEYVKKMIKDCYRTSSLQ